jgi:hypothetical protein
VTDEPELEPLDFAVKKYSEARLGYKNTQNIYRVDFGKRSRHCLNPLSFCLAKHCLK